MRYFVEVFTRPHRYLTYWEKYNQRGEPTFFKKTRLIACNCGEVFYAASPQLEQKVMAEFKRLGWIKERKEGT